MDIVAPYTASTNSSNNPGYPGRKYYPPGTTFTGLNATCWTKNEEANGDITLRGNYGVKAPNKCNLLINSAPYAFDLQAQLTNGTWITYQRFEGLYNQTGGFGSPLAFIGESGDNIADMLRNTDSSMPDAAQVNEFYRWRGRGNSAEWIKTDPRTMRFGLSAWGQANAANPFNMIYSPQNDNLGYSVRSTTNAYRPPPLYDWMGTNFCVPGTSAYSSGWSPASQPQANAGYQITSGLQGGFQVASASSTPLLFGLVSNNPDVLDNANPARYPDPDGVIRPGDGYFGALPTVPGRIADRPLLLNRPFRSVGELGYVFRDVPWKTLDFFSRRSGDLGLLDVFSISETDGDLPLTAGQINLNTRQTAVLAAVLLNSSKQLPGVSASVPHSELTAAQANTIAAAIVAESTARPFSDKGDLVTRVLNSGVGIDPLAPAPGDPPQTVHEAALKTAREAAVRTLAEIGTTRTWNFLIDLVAQTGRFTAASKSGSDFMVQGEERVWIHVAIDRMTGEILELRREVVNE